MLLFFCLLSVPICFVRFCFLLLLIKLFYEEKIKLWSIDHARSHCEFGCVVFALHAHGDVVLVMASQSLHSPASPCVNATRTLKVRERETEIDTVIDSSVSFCAK